jgi:hypothetical protein
MFFAVEIERWRFKVADHPVHQNIPGLQSALKLADKDLYSNIHTIFKLLIVLPVTSVCFSALHRIEDLGKVNNDRRMFVWLSNAPFSQKHGCESGKHFKTI